MLLEVYVHLTFLSLLLFLSFWQVEDSHSLPVAPSYDWITSDGSAEILYELDGQKRKYNGQ